MRLRGGSTFASWRTQKSKSVHKTEPVNLEKPVIPDVVVDESFPSHAPSRESDTLLPCQPLTIHSVKVEPKQRKNSGPNSDQPVSKLYILIFFRSLDFLDYLQFFIEPSKLGNDRYWLVR